jgi:hypothetical protein
MCLTSFGTTSDVLIAILGRFSGYQNLCDSQFVIPVNMVQSRLEGSSMGF